MSLVLTKLLRNLKGQKTEFIGRYKLVMLVKRFCRCSIFDEQPAKNITIVTRYTVYEERRRVDVIV